MNSHDALDGTALETSLPLQAVAVLANQGKPPRPTVVDVNEDYLCLWGVERSDVLGHSPRIVQHADMNQQLLEQISASLAPDSIVSNGSEEISGQAKWTCRQCGCRQLEWRVMSLHSAGSHNPLMVLIQRDISEQIERETALQRLATTDMLTGLNNRARFESLLKQSLACLQRYGHPASLIMLDIDDFKSINDLNGHDVGDVVLRDISRLLQTSVRKTDDCARWGGEEFVVLASETGLDQAYLLAEKIRHIVRDTLFPRMGRVTVSLGVAEVALNDTPVSIVKRADSALYQAKHGGRDQVAICQTLVPSAYAGPHRAIS